MGEVLRDEGQKFVRKVNDTLVLGEPKFCPRVFGLNGDMSAGLLFDTVEEAVCFFKAAKGVELAFKDSKGGEVMLRAVRDSSFNERLRNQVYWNLREETVEVLSKKTKWTEWEGAIRVEGSGPRGAVVLSNGDELWEIFRVDIAKRSTSHFVKPNLDALGEWGADPNEVEEIVRKALAKSSLRSRIHSGAS